MRKSLKGMLLGVCIILCLMFIVTPVNAQSTAIPNILGMTAYPVGSGGYALSTGICTAIQKKTGKKIRVIPSGTDIGRLAPLRTGKVNFTLVSGATGYFANLGLNDFADPGIGPFPLQMVYAGEAALSVFVREDSGIKTAADLRGKRIPYVPGATAINKSMEGVLAFGGLTWDDVKRIQASGYGASMKGVINGTWDASVSQATSSVAFELAASRHGIAWIQLPVEDKEGWARFRKKCPYSVHASLARGAAVSKENPIDVASYPYPIWMLKDADEETAYWLAKNITETYEDFKNTHVELEFWSYENQIRWAKKKLVYPFHPGAVKYFKERGSWTKMHDSWNQKMIKQQEDIQKAWDDLQNQMVDMGWKRKEMQSKWNQKVYEITGFQP